MANCDAGLGALNGQVMLTAYGSVLNYSGTPIDVTFRSDFIVFCLFSTHGSVSHAGTVDLQPNVADNSDGVDTHCAVSKGRRLSVGFAGFTQDFGPSATARFAQVYAVKTDALSMQEQVAIDLNAQSDRSNQCPAPLASGIHRAVQCGILGTEMP